MDALIQVDTLAHEIYNFVAMLKLHNANLYGNKTKHPLTWNLFFRRKNMAPDWLRLMDSVDTDKNAPPAQDERVPEMNNQTHTGKRINGEWHQSRTSV